MRSPAEQAAQDVDGVEPLPELVAPAGLVVEALAMADGPDRACEADRHRDRPGERQRRRGVGSAHHEQCDRRDARRRGEEGVLERTEAEDAHARLSLIHISEPTRQAEISYAVFCL